MRSEVESVQQTSAVDFLTVCVYVHLRADLCFILNPSVSVIVAWLCLFANAQQTQWVSDMLSEHINFLHGSMKVLVF